MAGSMDGPGHPWTSKRAIHGSTEQLGNSTSPENKLQLNNQPMNSIQN